MPEPVNDAVPPNNTYCYNCFKELFTKRRLTIHSKSKGHKEILAKRLIRDLRAFQGFWPEDEKVEDFIQTVKEWRGREYA